MRPDLTLILAGGRARRLGGVDKALLTLREPDTLLSFLLRRLRPQCGPLAISANGDGGRFTPTGLPVLSDPVGPDWGPLAGVLAGLDQLAGQSPDGWLLTVPCDTPLVPPDLVALLGRAVHDSGAACARATSGGRRHPLVALWSARLREPMRKALCEGGLRRVEAFQQAHDAQEVSWPPAPYDPFLNANTPADLDVMRGIAAGLA